MTCKYFCDYCGEEFDRPEGCRVHEYECANALKNEILVYTKALGWLDSKTFIESNTDLSDILIIKNTGHKALYVIEDLFSKMDYYAPMENTTYNPRNGFYYWSVTDARWRFVEEWDGILTRIVRNDSNIEGN